MKKIFLLALIITVGSAAAWFSVKAENPEEHAVRQALEHYFRGHATGQGEHFRKVFHPDSKLFAVRDGKYWQLTSEEYIARASGKPAADEEKRMRRIDSIDITGNAAIAKTLAELTKLTSDFNGDETEIGFNAQSRSTIRRSNSRITCRC